MDITFITNEEGQSLKSRFEQLIKDTRYFDCLVGYFYLSGFYSIYKALEKTEKVRILIGIGLSRNTYEALEQARDFVLSHYETKDLASRIIEEEMAESEDRKEVDEGVRKFIDWIQCGKLEIRAYPSQNIHAKVYVMTFKEGDKDVGRVITGSSNFTQSGLEENLEFNVELKNRADYEFAKQKFEELWQSSVDVSEKFVQTINERTWLNDNITPYELYLKFLYEYFKDELSRIDEISTKYLPEHFKKLEYQRQAVLNAKKILEEYGGVFISDVVGLGKTYVAAMLASELDGRAMVIAPPALLNRGNPGSWPNVFSDFHLPAEFISVGKLSEAKREMECREYKNIIIDESHRFRNESTISYEDVAEICRGKRVILVSATPYNNSPMDILAQLKLFQNLRRSTIPGMADLEGFFSGLQARLNAIDRRINYSEYLKTVSDNAKEIREKVLKYVMVRRTRSEIEKYFKSDLENNKVRFPQVNDPVPIFYQLTEDEDDIFMRTVELVTREFMYARYMPLLYLKRDITPLEEQSQKNLGGFMKVLLVKRLESSFFAFRKTIDRFIYSYQMFLKEYENGNVYLSKKYINKIFEFLEEGDDESIQKLIDEGKAERYGSEEFRLEFYDDLKNDLAILINIKEMWSSIKRDPKLEKLIQRLRGHAILRNNKLIIFTESKETAEYLTETINHLLGKQALLFHGQVSEYIKDIVIENFDARARNKKDEYRILVTTDVLAEGVNLHRSNIVLNYDIPWNPTKLMQRVGRINRIDTQFDEVHTYNFFPTKQADSEIELTHIARSKIEAFLNLLGADAAVLTEGEPVESHELFDKLISKKTIIGEEEAESELKYLRIIEEVRDKNPNLFEKIKKLPKKSRSSRKYSDSKEEIADSSFLITFFRKGRLMKFYGSASNKEAVELDFLTAARIFECDEEEKRATIPLEVYYELLEKNKQAFFNSTIEEFILPKKRQGRDNTRNLIKILKITQKNSRALTEEQEEYLRILINRLEEGAIPKSTVKKALDELNELKTDIQNPIKVIAVLQASISPAFLKRHYAETSYIPIGKREVILNLFVGKD
jgi:superfamily II DNA/RNA helicase